MKEGISIKENKSLNEFLNIRKIEDNFLYTLDKQVISFIRVQPINTELFSEEELIQKMNSSSVEFSNEQQPYTIFIIPRKVDIADFIKEQEDLKKKLKDEASIRIVEKRIIATHEMVANKNIIENEFYLCIWENASEDVEEKLEKREMKAIANCINNSFEIVENVNSKDLENKFVIKDETTYVLSLLIINKIILLERIDSNIYTSSIDKSNMKDNYIIVNKFAKELLKNYLEK